MLVPAVQTKAATFKGEIILLCNHSIFFKLKRLNLSEDMRRNINWEKLSSASGLFAYHFPRQSWF